MLAGRPAAGYTNTLDAKQRGPAAVPKPGEWEGEPPSAVTFGHLSAFN